VFLIKRFYAPYRGWIEVPMNPSLFCLRLRGCRNGLYKQFVLALQRGLFMVYIPPPDFACGLGIVETDCRNGLYNARLFEPRERTPSSRVFETVCTTLGSLSLAYRNFYQKGRAEPV
jgi:hypothetical protein